MEEEKKSQFMAKIQELVSLRRHYNISLEELLQMVCQRERLKLKRNKKSFNIKFGGRNSSQP